MSDINKFLLELRKARGLTLREAAEKSGLSHSYISSLENGKHPRTKAPIVPSPESLKGLAKAYNYDHDDLMYRAGHTTENKKENTNVLSESDFETFIREREIAYGVNLRDDPILLSSLRQLVESIAQTKVSQRKNRSPE